MLSNSLSDKAKLVIQSESSNFTELLELSGLDPSKNLRYFDWSNIDFCGCDLRGFDFTGARLHNCKFDGALIEGAIFHEAELEGSKLEDAADWEKYLASKNKTNSIKNDSRELLELNEVKVIVVGEEAVGKTSLIRYLVNNQPRNPDERKTAGARVHDSIQTYSWQPDSKKVKLNFWDFGGQDIYHNIHRYFLTERSLYLLVLEDRRENDKSIYRWLRTIRDRAGNAPVLVVINKSEEGKAKLQLDETGLQENYENIVGFIRSCCDPDEWSQNSIQELREKIFHIIQTDERLKHIYDKVTPGFMRVRQDVKEELASNKILDHARFAEICAKGADGNVSENEAITDEAEQRGILSTLDHLGVIVAKGYDRKQPLAVRHVHMLDPTWLTDAIYTILTKTKESLNNGEFQKEALSEWLSQKDYNETHHDYVLEMMQHKDIGLCFKLPDVEPETYLVPEALGVQTPHLNIKDDALRFRYRYDILPDGLIPRFIIEANRYLPENCARWRRVLP